MKGQIVGVVLLAVIVVGVGSYLAKAPVSSPTATPTLVPAATEVAVASATASPSPGWESVPPDSSPSPSASVGPGNSPGTPNPNPTTVALGAFIPGAASNPKLIDAYARLTGVMPSIIMWYQAWAGSYASFQPEVANAVRARGATPMISWEPSAGPTVDPNWTLSTIVAGKHDVYIRTWTHAVAAWGHELYVRLMYEMNGDWAPWCAYANGNTVGEFISAWRHIVDIARQQHATNIRWIWSPNVYHDGLGRPFVNLYPGDGYVDWVALDGFNRGTSWSTTKWVDAVRIFGDSVDILQQLTSKPIMIAETGSTEVGGSKADWITQSFGRIPYDLPQIRAIVWYDENEAATGIDWRVNSSASSLAAFRKVATSKLFLGRLP